MASIETLLERNKGVIHTPFPYLSERPSGEPATRTFIVSCMDPRCIPERIFNLDAGEVAVHRNAGGNIRDALRDINILDTLVKLKEILIIHHTDCGTLHVTDEQIRARLKTYVDKDNWANITKMNFGANTNIEESVRGDLEWFRANPLVREELKQGCQGFVYDIKTGELKKVETV